MEAEKIIAQAKIRLIRHHPFFATCCLYLQPKEANETCPTTAVTQDGTLLFNRKFIESLTVEQVLWVISHEVLHVVFDVFRRRGHRIPVLWNCSHDFAINLILEEVSEEAHRAGLSTMEPIEGALLDHKYKGWIAENIYDDLKKQCKEHDLGNGVTYYELPKLKGVKGKEKDKQHGMGTAKGCCDHDNPCDDPNKPRLTPEDWKGIVARAVEAAKGRGNLPGVLGRLINEILEPVLPWKEIVRRFIANCVKGDYSWKRPARRSHALGVYLPKWAITIPELICVIDASGSTTEYQKRFLSEVAAVIELLGGNMRVICHDAVITFDGTVDTWKEVKGFNCGGTDFKPVFDKLKEENARPSGMIYFTDTDGEMPTDDPEYPVLWCVTRQPDDQMKKYLRFGEVTQVVFENGE